MKVRKIVKIITLLKVCSFPLLRQIKYGKSANTKFCVRVMLQCVRDLRQKKCEERGQKKRQDIQHLRQYFLTNVWLPYLNLNLN